jgi:hypothetical protein
VPTVKFDVSKSDPAKATASFEPPPPGVYKAKITECAVTKPSGKDRRIEVVLEAVKNTGKKKVANGQKWWEYINLESEAAVWKLDQFLQAFGLANGKKRKGSFDPEDLVGELCLVRCATETDNKEDPPTKRSRCKAILALDAEDESDDESDDDDDDSSDDDDDDSADDDDDDEDSDSSDDSEEEEEDAEAQNYDDMSLSELKAECKERGLKAEGSRSVITKRLQKSDEQPFDDE